MPLRSKRLSPAVLVAAALAATAATAAPLVFTVNSTADLPDGNPGDQVCSTDGGTVCTLRAAITEANLSANDGGLDVIGFALPSCAFCTIATTSPLPDITDPILIDGYTQTGATPNTQPTDGGLNAFLRVAVNGASAGAGADGLVLATGSGGSTVRGLLIHGFASDGIEVRSSDNSIVGDDLFNNDNGVRVSGGANNAIGGTQPALRNLISGNQNFGVWIEGSTATLNRLEGNLIGTGESGTDATANAVGGVRVTGSATGNVIGGPGVDQRNVISGNGAYGVELNSGSNTVQGNYIGADVTGADRVANIVAGIFLSGGSAHVIGGDTSTQPNVGNLISGNQSGMEVGSPNNSIYGNRIGTAADGNTALANNSLGIRLRPDAGFNTVGGSAGTANLLSGNGGFGLFIESDNNVIQSNIVGPAASGGALGNGSNGIQMSGAQVLNNTIGGESAEQANYVSGNGGHGITLGDGAQGNLVVGNFIGVSPDGGVPLGNTGSGVIVSSASGNQIGGQSASQGNVIANNGSLSSTTAGITVSSGTDNALLRNRIFDNVGLGIDLEFNGVTPNDTGDGDTGANDLQNFPVLTSASTNGTVTTVAGTLNSTPNTIFRVEFFSTPVCDGSGFGEANQFLEATQVTTDASGNVAFSANLSVGTTIGENITATATNLLASPLDTSELSQCRIITDDPGGHDVGLAKGGGAFRVPSGTAGSTVTVVLKIRNYGTHAETLVPFQVSGDATYSAGCRGNAASLSGDGDLDPGETVTVPTCTVTYGARGTYTHTVTVDHGTSGANVDVNSSNNTATKTSKAR